MEPEDHECPECGEMIAESIFNEICESEGYTNRCRHCEEAERHPCGCRYNEEKDDCAECHAGCTAKQCVECQCDECGHCLCPEETCHAVRPERPRLQEKAGEASATQAAAPRTPPA